MTNNKGLTPEAINDDLKNHTLGLQDRRYKNAVANLHQWAARFNDQFRLDLQTPAIGIDRIRGRVLGTYQHRNALGLRHEILLAADHIEQPMWNQLATLLHEMIHQWQDQFGRVGKNGYHNRQFRTMAAKFGLIEDERGRTIAIEPGHFTQLLAKHGVDMATLPIVEEQSISPFTSRRRGDSTMKKWACPCGINVRCAVHLAARCLRCGGDFEEASAAW